MGISPPGLTPPPGGKFPNKNWEFTPRFFYPLHVWKISQILLLIFILEAPLNISIYTISEQMYSIYGRLEDNHFGS